MERNGIRRSRSFGNELNVSPILWNRVTIRPHARTGCCGDPVRVRYLHYFK